MDDRTNLSEKQRHLLKLIHASSKTIGQWVDYTQSNFHRTLPIINIHVHADETEAENKDSVSVAVNDNLIAPAEEKTPSVRFDVESQDKGKQAAEETLTVQNPNFLIIPDPIRDEAYRNQMFSLRRGSTAKARQYQEKVRQASLTPSVSSR